MQTPHHFYSPDPFERNLRGRHDVPNEGQLFYGLIQDGNDLWNATFFCGSCAVMRRTAVESIGGFATETVTEDAHTALRMHRDGWNSAYLRLPLAAGLATERLAIHVGQRMRWARGMTQIFRIDNPLLGRGLSFGQRVCYLNAMLHFFFGLPRFVFLTAPLAYLMFRLNIIAASGLMVIVYAAPHLIHSTVTNSRLQSRYRHSFWGEIYESVLALYILRPTLATLINPKRGKFNVTEKGGLLPNDYFDYKIVRPHLIIMGLLVIALIIGVVRWALSDLADTEVLVLNVAWAIFNLLTIGAAIAVGRETRQLRGSVRLGLEVPSVIHLPDGQTLITRSRNLSTTGGLFIAERPDGVALDEIVQIELPIGDRNAVLPGRVVAWDGEVLRVTFEELTLRQQRDLVRVVLVSRGCVARLGRASRSIGRCARCARSWPASAACSFGTISGSPRGPRPKSGAANASCRAAAGGRDRPRRAARGWCGDGANQRAAPELADRARRTAVHRCHAERAGPVTGAAAPPPRRRAGAAANARHDSRRAGAAEPDAAGPAGIARAGGRRPPRPPILPRRPGRRVRKC